MPQIQDPQNSSAWAPAIQRRVLDVSIRIAYSHPAAWSIMKRAYRKRNLKGRKHCGRLGMEERRKYKVEKNV
ncbi:hypothetical protein IAQ61_005239 [Plenodomus lingam]|uniref:uncharacterized protein n=1 Tax=Leptosphaeria maculans TaxID=5022 RepID=UPI003323A718|nr:hypothetical protein IAQ61_005239 [Plenodomus lingam]